MTKRIDVSQMNNEDLAALLDEFFSDQGYSYKDVLGWLNGVEGLAQTIRTLQDISELDVLPYNTCLLDIRRWAEHKQENAVSDEIEDYLARDNYTEKDLLVFMVDNGHLKSVVQTMIKDGMLSELPKEIEMEDLEKYVVDRVNS